MTLEQYWTLLLKQWKLVVICLLFVGSGAFIGGRLMKPIYQSSTLVQVVIRSGNNNPADINNLMASDQLLQTEATLATSIPVLREVVSHYPNLTASQLAGEVSSSPRTGTQIFEIDVVDPSQTRAASLANDIAATLIKQQQLTIEQNNAQAQQQIQQNIDQTIRKINDITAEISALQDKGGEQGQIAILQVQLSGLQQQYSQLQTALAQLDLLQAQSGNPLQVAQPAQPASSPVRPNIPLYTGVGLLAGLLLGMLLALLYERLDTRVRTPDDLAQLLAWPILATVWRAKSSNHEDVVNPTGHTVDAEPYRALRANIGFSSIDKPMRSLVVTSALPRDGKSVVAANLAIFMARAGKNTLLIDADLHHPTQHTFFNLTPDKLGLSNAILEFSMPGIPITPPYSQDASNTSTLPPRDELATTTNSLGPFVHAVGIPNLWVMPTGSLPPNPSELFESKAMQRFLEVIASCVIEIVIFDTPPLLDLSDTSILASKIDGALIVVDTTRATKDKLRRAKAALSQTGVHVLGCVANKVHRKRNDSTYYYFTEEQASEAKSTRNEYSSAIPITPMLDKPPSRQGFRSDENGAMARKKE